MQTMPATTPLGKLDFLIGEWIADAKPGEPTGGFSFAYQLQGYIIVRTNFADSPASGERDASRHEDLMVIYMDENQTIKADYYDSEGHIIRYSGQPGGENKVVFTSNPEPETPAFRLGYRMDEQGILHGTFEIAQPSTPETFQPYLSWSARRTE